LKIRLLVAGIFWLFVYCAWGQSQLTSAPSACLILIDRANSLPPVDENLAPQQMWAIWPTSLTDSGSNRLLSIFTGMDWQGSNSYSSFREVNGGWVDSYFNDLQDTGYFKARNQITGGRQIYAISSPVGGGSVSNRALLLALNPNDNPIRAIPYKRAFPAGIVSVFIADNWEQQQFIERKIMSQGGRVLTMEIPDSEEIQWARIWLSPKGWPGGFPVDQSTRVSGLIRSSSAGNLLLNPNKFSWSVTPEQIDSPALWFSHVRFMGPGLLAGLGILIIFVVGVGLYLVSIEQKGGLAALLVVIAIETPATFLGMDNLSKTYGLASCGYWLLLVAVLLGISSLLLSALIRLVIPNSHALTGSALACLVTVILTNPQWSIFSGVFGYTSPSLSPESFGFLTGYLTLFIAGIREGPKWTIVISAVISGLLCGLALDKKVWWCGNDTTYAALPILAWLAGAGLLKWPLSILFGLLPNGNHNLFQHGVTWAPVYCYQSFQAKNALNLGRHFTALISPALLILASVIGCVFLFSDRFVLRQLKSIVDRDKRTMALASLSMGLFVMGILNPNLWPAAVYVGIGWVLVVCFGGVWSI